MGASVPKGSLGTRAATAAVLSVLRSPEPGRVVPGAASEADPRAHTHRPGRSEGLEPRPEKLSLRAQKV